jgi:hypothetical protein
VDVLGLRIGRRLAGYLDLGFGFNGIVNLGVAYEF